MNKELISIIIPVYNVKAFICRCIDSILNQTYKNIDVILVDDGSTDGSSLICDNYSIKYANIRAFHTRNHGLSAARNYGIKKAKGNFIMFIDSDDFIPEFAVETLLNGIIKYNADIACGKLYKIYPNETNPHEINNCKYILLDNEKALENMMYMHNITNSASGKLYKRKLFDNIEFPEGRLYEDLGTIYNVLGKSSKVVITDDIVYYYYQNNNSIIHKKYTPKRLDAFYFAMQELNYVKDNYKKIINSAIYRTFFESVSIINDMPVNCDDSLILWQYIKNNRKRVIDDDNILLKQKLLCLSSFFGTFGIKFSFFIKRLRKAR